MKLILLCAVALAALAAAQALAPSEGSLNDESSHALSASSGSLAGIGCSIKVLARGAALAGEYFAKCLYTSIMTGPLFFVFFPNCVISSGLDIINITVEDLQRCA